MFKLGINHSTIPYVERKLKLLAERAGFEPALGYYPKHAFQACDLNRSSTSPLEGGQHKPEWAEAQYKPNSQTLSRGKIVSPPSY